MKRLLFLAWPLILLWAVVSSGSAQSMKITQPHKDSTETATFGGGCFWCMEALFKTVKGVESVTCGYAGGHTKNPTYEQVCSDTTGHAEVIQVRFNPAVITYDQLLDLFWEAHDPTTLDRQGNDVGTQYRSIVLYGNEAQKQSAEKSKAEAAKHFSKPIVTAIVPLTAFYKAEDYHQDYFLNHSNAPYCQLVIAPKLKKFEAETQKP